MGGRLKPIWFRKVGWFYRPASVIGCVLTALTIALSVYAFRMIDNRLHSASHTMLFSFPYTASLFALLWRTASLTSPRDNF